MESFTADQGFLIAYDLYKNGRYADAELMCQKVLNASPQDSVAWLFYAMMAHRFGKTAEGDHFLEKAVENKEFSIVLDTPHPPQKPRWSPHARINSILEADLKRYEEMLRSFEPHLPWLEKIDFESDPERPTAPFWNNIWLPVLDAVTLYCLMVQQRPRYYVEIGSGNSTKFAARAIADHGLDTRIISIDPQPRAEVDALCSKVIRQPLEKSNLDIFRELEANDIVFADNSHRSFMNSDVTVFFCDVLPALKSGVTVGIHDIFLPYDYPEYWDVRYYSEQYLLACYLLGRTRIFDVLLPVYFAASRGMGEFLMRDIRRRAADPQWRKVSSDSSDALWRNGSSFWLRMR